MLLHIVQVGHSSFPQLSHLFTHSLENQFHWNDSCTQKLGARMSVVLTEMVYLSDWPVY